MSLVIRTYDRLHPALGRNVVHDSRSYAYRFQASKPVEEVDTFWNDKAPILDQGEVGGCVGFTGADILNTDAFSPVRAKFNGGNYYDNQGGLNFYHMATVADSIKGVYPPDDTGSSGLGLAKALKKAGMIDGYTHAFTWDQFVAAILHQPVALGTAWTQKMFTPDKNGVAKVGPISERTVQGGHEYMARGISFTKSLVLCRNHWANTWDEETVGQKLPGEFWLTFNDLKKLLKSQGDVTVLHGVGMP